MTEITKASAILEKIANSRAGQKTISDDDEITLFELVELLQGKGFGILLIMFSFPMAIPLPYPPGFTTILGLPLVIFSMQMILGYKQPKLPAWIGRKSFKFNTMSNSLLKVIPYILKIEKYIKPRMKSLMNPTTRKIVGIVSIICAICITLPIPFGNAIPSAGILIMSLGIINEDAITTLLGVMVGIIGIIVAAIFGFLIFVVTTKYVLVKFTEWFL